MKTFIDDREVEITETNYDDGHIQVISATFVDDETELNEDEMLCLEVAYQQSLVEGYYGTLADQAEALLDCER